MWIVGFAGPRGQVSAFSLHIIRGWYTGEDGFEVLLSLFYLRKSALTFILRRPL